MTCTCHQLDSFCTAHNRYTESASQPPAKPCTCLRPFGLEIPSMSCPQHGWNATQAPPAGPHATLADLEHINGLRARPVPLVGDVSGVDPADFAPPMGMIAADIMITRLVTEPVSDLPWFDPAPRAALPVFDAKHPQICTCDLPSMFGHDTGCVEHPGPILSDPLQLLVAAVQLIPDQPTTEQWQTIKKAINGLVPSPFRSPNAD